MQGDMKLNVTRDTGVEVEEPVYVPVPTLRPTSRPSASPSASPSPSPSPHPPLGPGLIIGIILGVLLVICILCLLLSGIGLIFVYYNSKGGLSWRNVWGGLSGSYTPLDSITSSQGDTNKYSIEDILNDLSIPCFPMSSIEFIEVIGRGAEAEVWKAKYRNHLIAVKKTRMLIQGEMDQRGQQLLKEIKLMSKLRHSNIVQFIGVAYDENTSELGVVQELMTEGGLDRVIRKHPDLSLSTKLQIALDIARGMAYLHSFSPAILHRDLKPSNCLVDADLRVKIADFGASRGANSAITQIGTPLYMAPEVCRGEHYTEKADVFSFGVTIWQLYTGKEPYSDYAHLMSVQIMQKVAEGSMHLVVPGDCPSDLAALLSDCLSMNSSNRPNFFEIVQRLQIFVDESRKSVIKTSQSRRRPSFKLFSTGFRLGGAEMDDASQIIDDTPRARGLLDYDDEFGYVQREYSSHSSDDEKSALLG